MRRTALGRGAGTTVAERGGVHVRAGKCSVRAVAAMTPLVVFFCLWDMGTCFTKTAGVVTSPPKEMCVSFIATGPVTG